MMATTEKPKIVNQAREAIIREFQNEDIPIGEATKLADSAVAALQNTIGGQNVFFPAIETEQNRHRMAERNSTMRRLYEEGATFEELAKRFGVGERRVQQIIKTDD